MRRPLVPRAALLAPSLALLALAGCGSGSPVGARAPGGSGAGSPDAPGARLAAALDPGRAWGDLEHVVALGPRPAGSAALERLRVWLEDELRAAGLEPVREPFRADTPIGAVDFCNLYADLPGKSDERIVLASHVDTKRLPFRFVGANDAGSSTALLLELARVLAASGEERPYTIRFLFLDGEECVHIEWNDDSLYGSRHHVRLLRERGELERVRALVLLDLVADPDLALERDTNSHPGLLEVFVRTAAAMGRADLFARRRIGVEDDHVPFREEGIPAVDLIDLSYGPANSWHHGEGDVLANCSIESLASVGRLVLTALPAVEAWVAR